ncbi:hypothetical protein ISN44_As07g029220 [Arabidopsis suecica]|uniref:NYN domain-containing protein n=1 Tax=Arabidopsis suecica TaxID=45249 RepID=A0A8T2BT23_ARASU|nr:hypothetical protein ISN44_As07g029220 [Arabidopsis suecica]
MFKCIDDNPPPANILGICDLVALPRPESGYNLFGPFSYSYSSPEENAISWISLILAESETLEEDTCSETDESTSWFCLMRDPRTGDHLSGQGFESFSRHLSSLEHEKERFDYLPFESLENKDIAREEDENPPTIVRNQPKMATPEEAVAVTSVFWDINTFPVPPGFDAHLVSLCIKRFLEKHGYSGRLTITAVGHLSHIPDCILRALSSTGITLCHAPRGSKDIKSPVSVDF